MAPALEIGVGSPPSPLQGIGCWGNASWLSLSSCWYPARLGLRAQVHVAQELPSATPSLSWYSQKWLFLIQPPKPLSLELALSVLRERSGKKLKCPPYRSLAVPAKMVLRRHLLLSFQPLGFPPAQRCPSEAAIICLTHLCLQQSKVPPAQELSPLLGLGILFPPVLCEAWLQQWCSLLEPQPFSMH